MRNIQLDTIPSVGSMLLKSASARKAGKGKAVFQPLQIEVAGIGVDAARLAKYREVCGFERDGALPLTFPHVMAFALHLALLMEPECPYSPMGAVHIRNRIRQQRPLQPDELLDFTVRLGDAEQVAKGHEVSIVTEVRVEGELVWDDLSVMLIRKGGTGNEAKKPASAPHEDFPEQHQWQLPADLGRRYAAASGDFNPIHLYPLTARLMGFKRQIVHGMWSKARAVAQLQPAQTRGPVTVDVAFKLPVFLPAEVTLLYAYDDDACRFELRDGAGEKPHLKGTIVKGTGCR